MPIATPDEAEVASSTKAVAVDYDKILSPEASARYPSPLKRLAGSYLGLPGIINFGGGLPAPSTFPLARMTLEFPYLTKAITVPNETFNTVSTTDFARSVSHERPDLHVDLSTALQYGGSSGNIKLLTFLKEHVRREGGVGYSNWDMILTSGSTDGLDNVFRMLLSRGSSVLVEAFAYPGTLAALVPQGVRPIAVPLDHEGVDPRAMEFILDSWDEAVERRPKPKAIVLVPTGQNPTGSEIGAARRWEIYQVARRHGLMIICDDPYRNLRLNLPNYRAATSPTPPPTFLSLDVDGRVISLSSFSKIVAPGCRLGWLVAPAPLIVKLSQRNEVTVQSQSGFSVCVVAALLGGLGGHDGWERYLEDVAVGYSTRANRMLDLFKEHLPGHLVEYEPPTAGMFICVRVKAELHPTLSPIELLDAVFDRFIQNLVILTPSSVFHPAQEDGSPTPMSSKDVFFRASFSSASESDMEEGVRRMGRALRDVFGEKEAS